MTKSDQTYKESETYQNFVAPGKKMKEVDLESIEFFKDAFKTTKRDKRGKKHILGRTDFKDDPEESYMEFPAPKPSGPLYIATFGDKKYQKREYHDSWREVGDDGDDFESGHMERTVEPVHETKRVRYIL